MSNIIQNPPPHRDYSLDELKKMNAVAFHSIEWFRNPLNKWVRGSSKHDDHTCGCILKVTSQIYRDMYPDRTQKPLYWDFEYYLRCACRKLFNAQDWHDSPAWYNDHEFADQEDAAKVCEYAHNMLQKEIVTKVLKDA